jgi:hypothetical protein
MSVLLLSKRIDSALRLDGVIVYDKNTMGKIPLGPILTGFTLFWGTGLANRPNSPALGLAQRPRLTPSDLRTTATGK